jgi:UDPglucose 6-dehydrogenase
MDNARLAFPGLECAESALDAVRDADLLLILTDWEEFKLQDFRAVGELMRRRDILDTRNCLEPLSVRRLGFTYEGVGR